MHYVCIFVKRGVYVCISLKPNKKAPRKSVFVRLKIFEAKPFRTAKGAFIECQHDKSLIKGSKWRICWVFFKIRIFRSCYFIRFFTTKCSFDF